MNQRNLIIGAIVLVGGYFVYKKYYAKKTTIAITKPILPLTEPIRDKGEAIEPTPVSSFDSFDDDGL